MIDVTELTTVNARQRFADLVNRVAYGGEWVVLTRRGKPVAGAVPLEEFMYFEGPEGASDLQGVETFDDIMVWHANAQPGEIGEASVVYQVDNAIRRVTSAEARNHLSDVLNRVSYAKERIIVTRRNRDLFVLIPPEVFDKYLEIDALEEEHDIRVLEEAERKGELDDTIPLDKLLERYKID